MLCCYLLDFDGLIVKCNLIDQIDCYFISVFFRLGRKSSSPPIVMLLWGGVAKDMLR